MDRSQWTNKYVELVRTLPSHLVHVEEKSPSPAEVVHVRALCSTFPETYVELGSGSGGHLITRASQDRESLYIGFELRYKRAFRTAEKALKQNISNLLVIRTDAANLDCFFAPESLSGIYMNFPDPWDRKKWKKHRMVNDRSLRIFHSLLKPGGWFRYKTDHEGYFDDSIKLIEESMLFSITKMTRDLHLSDYAEGNVTTEFERLFISQGLPAYFVEITK